MRFELGDGQSLYYEHDAPSDGQPTFVFINALTGSTAAWQAEIGPALRKQGFGTLSYNFRGQAESRFAEGDVLDEETITGDLARLVEEIISAFPVFVGLSIGGLYAARAILKGTPARGLVLINTLRKPGVTLSWINEATSRAARLGGAGLLMDMYLPMLVGPAFLEKMRTNCLGDGPYAPLSENEGAMQLMLHSRTANWDIEYEKLDLPVLVLTGLRDRVFYNAADVAALLTRLEDVHEVTFPDYGHLLPMEAGSETASALAAFVDKLT